MPDDYVDPSGNTQAFRAFVQSPEPAQDQPSARLPLIIGGAAGAAVIILVLIAWLVLA